MGLTPLRHRGAVGAGEVPIFPVAVVAVGPLEFQFHEQGENDEGDERRAPPEGPVEAWLLRCGSFFVDVGLEALGVRTMPARD